LVLYILLTFSSNSIKMMKVLVVLMAVASTMASPTFKKQFFEPIEGMIVGGAPATRGEFPHMVWLQIGTSFACGGAVINANSVMSAAHCCTYQPSQYTVVSGDHVRNQNHGSEQRKTVTQVIRHPQYNSNTLANDICVLKTSSAFTMDQYTQAATLAASGSTPSGNLVVTGWGAVSEGGSTSQTLLKVTVPYVTDAACKAAYGQNEILAGMVCAGTGGRDSCQGDSGGPMHQGNAIVGVVSWGIGCARPGYPGVYSGVGYFRTWLNSQM